MILETNPSYSSGRSYVLKLHRDATSNRLVGRLENLTNGKQVAFTNSDELLAILVRDLAREEKRGQTPFPIKCEF